MAQSRSQKQFLKKYHSPDIYAWEWAAVGAVVLLTMMSFVYIDTKSLTVWSANLWEVISQGKLLHFYEYTAENIYDLRHQYMGCDIFAILPLAIWNLPIWIIQHTSGTPIVSSPGMLLWSKIGLEVCTIATAHLAYKMTMLITKDKARSMWAAMLTVGSSVCIIGVGVAGQTDIFVVLYAAFSVYFMMKGDKKLMLLFAALSIAVKPFFIFALLPLVLLTQKNIFKAALECALSLTLMGVFRVIGGLFPLYKESMSQGPSVKILFNLTDTGFEAPYGKSSFFLIGLLILCFVAYFTEPESDEERNRYYIYIATAVFLIMNAFGKTEFYRAIVIMPYFSVLLVSNTKYFRFNLFLSFVFQFSYTFALSCASHFALSSEYTTDSIFSKVFAPHEEFSQVYNNNFYKIVLNSDANGYVSTFLINAFSGIAVLAAVLILVLNYPKFKHEFDMGKKGEFEKYDHGLLLLNSLVYLPSLLMLYIMYFNNLLEKKQ